MTPWTRRPLSNSAENHQAELTSFSQCVECSDHSLWHRAVASGHADLSAETWFQEKWADFENPGWLFDIGDYTTQLYRD